ncbi:MAG: hypothetical protein WBG43_07150 [Marinifilaceae bacterium]
MNKERNRAIDILKQMMKYPGRFPILVLGDTGVGKTHWICENIHSIEGDNYLEKIVSVNSSIAEDSIQYWTDIFKSADNKFLIIDSVEKLTLRSQEIIFELLSTNNGKYGLNENEKNLEIRILFTSCFSIEELRNNRKHLVNRFFDRISQFVVVFPNFQDTQRNISNYFEETWNKFFNKGNEYHNKRPKSKELIKWLESIAYNMHGNYRDLDKIVINWNLQQIISKNKTEDQILEIIKKEFTELLKTPANKTFGDNDFIFSEDVPYGDMLTNFKKQLKEWSFNINNGNKKEAAQMLNVSIRTMERWK